MIRQAHISTQATLLQAQAKVLLAPVIGELAKKAADKYSDIIDRGERPDIDDIAADVGDVSFLVATPLMRSLVALAYSDTPYRSLATHYDKYIQGEAEFAVYDMIISHSIYRRRVGLDDEMQVAA